MGINTTFRSPTGQLFELQFHTPKSWEVKQVINHPLYEQYRVLPDSSGNKAILENQMRLNSSAIEVPSGIQGQVPSLKQGQ
jgi:hypothetical protein